MPFKAYLPSGFEHDHENVSFDSLVRVLNNHFGHDPTPHFLIGNVMFDGEELDAVFLKRNAISVIEMKNYGGMLRFSESTEWFADDKMVYGGRHLNPFLQVRTYKFALKGCLQRLQREILSPQRSIAWSQISGVVLFCKSIHFNEQEAHRVPDQIGWWFHVTDLDGIANKLASLDHQSLQLTDSELQKLLELRGFQDRHLYSNALPPGRPFGSPSAAEMRQPQPRIVYHKESHFRDHEMRMRNAAGARSAGALLVRRLLSSSL